MKTTAEGAETPEQMGRLIARGAGLFLFQSGSRQPTRFADQGDQ
jgi:hypothetical protein